MITALYPGSFDPLTHGHLDIVDRAAGMYRLRFQFIHHRVDGVNPMRMALMHKYISRSSGEHEGKK